jgi:omega-6 fatty acid desaturase (delta-12 desaturase)
VAEATNESVLPGSNGKMKKMQSENLKEALHNWRAMLKKYQKPDQRKAIFQLITSFLPFLGLLVLMYFSLNWSYLITLGLSVLAAFFLVRIFIIQHDCGHQSFLKSRKWNKLIGMVSSFFSTIPFAYWSRTHNAHHAHNGQMEYRGLGDIDFLTTEEYQALSPWKRFYYRVRRSAIVQFIVTPIVYLAVNQRYPFTEITGRKKFIWPLLLNNLLLVAVYGVLAILLGWQNLLMVQLPILMIFGTISFWFFYIQHQHEDNYKEWKSKWDHLSASILGSTYYKLPRVFQWFSGNIGFHHIHHLNSRIPNYNLELCVRENPKLNQFVSTLTFRQSLKCINYKLWDAQKQRMISFKEFAHSAQTRGDS